MRDYILKESYDNSRPLFLGGEFDGQIRAVAGAPKRAAFGGNPLPDDAPVYERWVFTSGREFVFYRLLGMTDAQALSALVRLALLAAVRMPSRRTEEMPCTQ